VSSYYDSLSYLYGLQSRGMKMGLRNIRALLRSLQNPHERYPSIHIAGTNGKGSTACLIASILTEGGYRVGLYTSPHLVEFNERIRINGKPVPEARLVRYVRRLKPVIERRGATFFEATTAIAFQYFADERAEIAVIETGLGGRLDSTNVLVPLVSVITNVSVEHREYLGNTLERIAGEKAGIIKRGVPVVTGSESPAVLRVLESTARQRRAPFWRSRDMVTLAYRTSADIDPRLDFRSEGLTIERVLLGLPGLHQVENARLALAALTLAMPAMAQRRGAASRPLFRDPGSIIRAGLEHVGRNTGLRARLESVGPGGRYLLDVAHNPRGMETLVAELGRRNVRKLIVVFGAMKDKDLAGMLRQIGKVAALVIAVRPSIDRAASAEAIARVAAKLGIRSRVGGSVRAGLLLAGARGRVLVTGSHYVVGEALTELDGKTA
jgi:dihydrofolate synthase/folylpolyglutamate synthase